MNVSAYELKTRCGEMIDRAAAGEEIVITKHGVIKAKLVSAQHFDPAQQEAVFDSMRKMKERMAAQGKRFTHKEIRAALEYGRK
jgi:prevent-host-death family protein